MNIAIFASAFHPSLGGVEELVRQLAHALIRRGHQVIVVTNRWPRDLPLADEYEGIPVYRLALRSPNPEQPWSRQTAMYKLTRAGVNRQAIDALKARGIEVLHVQCVSGNAEHALLAKYALDLPLMVTLQGELTMDSGGLYERSGWARGIMTDSLREAEVVTACSGQTLQEAETFYRHPFGERGQVIYNGIHLSEFEGVAPYEHQRPYMLAIGRHVPQKGFDILLRAYALLRAQLPDAPDLILAGDGDERSTLEQLSGELGLAGTAHFVGRAERAKTVSLFASCAFFVLPSRHEPFGIVNLEAMASGKAVVATRVGGVPEFVSDEQEGLLVPPADPEAMAAALLRLCRDPQLAARLGKAGRRKARDFDWDAIAELYEAGYERALTRHAARTRNGSRPTATSGGERIARSA